MERNLQLALIESVLSLEEVDSDRIFDHCYARLSELEAADQYWENPVPELVDYVLGQHTNLESITIISMLTVDNAVSLAPLAKLPALKSLRIYAGPVEDFEALFEAPALEELILGEYIEVVGVSRDEVLQKAADRGLRISE